MSGDESHRDLRARLSVVIGDIARLAVDAIVNAAEPSLLAGGGVDAAVHRAAGPKLRDECRSIGACPPGEARMTGGYGLPARWVIHAVGPVFRDGGAEDARLLASCYSESLRLAQRNEIETLAFPAIATGSHGYPIVEAARVAVRTVAAWLVANALPRHVTFCCARSRDARVYEATLEEFSI